MIHTLCGCWCVLCSSHVACCFAIDFSIGHHHRGIKFGTRFFFAYRIRIYTREHNNTKTNPFYFCISFRSVIQITIRHKLKNAPRKQQQQKTSTNNSPHDKSWLNHDNTVYSRQNCGGQKKPLEHNVNVITNNWIVIESCPTSKNCTCSSPSKKKWKVLEIFKWHFGIHIHIDTLIVCHISFGFIASGIFVFQWLSICEETLSLNEKKELNCLKCY